MWWLFVIDLTQGELWAEYIGKFKTHEECVAEYQMLTRDIMDDTKAILCLKNDKGTVPTVPPSLRAIF